MATLRWGRRVDEVFVPRSNQPRQCQEPAHCVALEDRQFWTDGRLQLSSDAVDGAWRAVYDGGLATRRGSYRSSDRRDVVDVSIRRRHARAERSGPAGCGPRPRLLDEWQRRADPLHHAWIPPAPTRCEDGSTGPDLRPGRDRRSLRGPRSTAAVRR